jgi:hypothetical protein
MKITQTALKRLIKIPGRHGDGHGLFLRVVSLKKRYWTYQYRVAGKVREMSLGSYPEIGLAEARARHAELRKQVVADGADPLHNQQRGQTSGVPTFGEAVAAYHETHGPTWKNERNRKQWPAITLQHCKPILDKPVNEIETADVLATLKPIWRRIPPTATLIRGRIESILDAARALAHIDEDKANPARWKGHLSHLLPNPSEFHEEQHHPAMPYAGVSSFMRELKEAPGVAPQALMFAILTAARGAEAVDATWDEIDWDARTWVVAARRMKTRVEHAVPVSDAALEVLQQRWKARRGR